MLKRTLLWRQQKTEPWGQPLLQMLEKEGEMQEETEKALEEMMLTRMMSDQGLSGQGILGKNHGQLCQWL